MNWQIRPTRDDSMARNDHSDQAWDERVLDALGGLDHSLHPVCTNLLNASIVSTGTPTDSPLRSIGLTGETALGLPGSGSTPATRSGSSFMRTFLPPSTSSAVKASPPRLRRQRAAGPGPVQ